PLCSALFAAVPRCANLWPSVNERDRAHNRPVLAHSGSLLRLLRAALLPLRSLRSPFPELALGAPSDLQHQALGVFDGFLDLDQEGHRLGAVDDAVVVAEG